MADFYKFIFEFQEYFRTAEDRLRIPWCGGAVHPPIDKVCVLRRYLALSLVSILRLRCNEAFLLVVMQYKHIVGVIYET